MVGELFDLVDGSVGRSVLMIRTIAGESLYLLMWSISRLIDFHYLSSEWRCMILRMNYRTEKLREFCCPLATSL